MLNAVLLTAALLMQDPLGDTYSLGGTTPLQVGQHVIQTPNGPKKTWTEVRASVFVGEDDDGPPAFPTAVATMRPESPAKPFTMVPVLIGPPDGVPIESDVAGAGLGMQFGSNAMGAELVSLIERAKQDAMELFKGDDVRIDPNIGIEAGGWTRRTYGHQSTFVDVFVRMETRQVVEGEDPPQWSRGNTIPIGTYEWHLPRRLPLREEFFPDVEKVVPEEVPHIGLPGGGTWGMPGDIFRIPLPTPGSGGTVPGGYQDQIGKPVPKPINFVMPPGSAGSMNEISYPAGNWSPGWTAEFPGGTLWYPDTPGYQVVGQLDQFRYGLAAAVQAKPATVRINCMNMGLKEPKVGVNYYPMRNPDPISSTIMNLPPISSRSLGPDQARTWIYTDKATLKEVNEKLIPKIDAGHYLTGLYQVASAGGLTDNDLNKKGMAEPELLPEAAAKKEAVRWLMSRLEKNRAKDVAAWLNKKPELLLLLFEQTNAAYGDRGQYVLNELIGSPNAEIRVAALKLVDGLGGHALPHLENRLPNLATAVMSGKKDEAELAWKVGKKYSQTLPKWVLELLAESKASKLVADEAKAMLKG